MIAALNCTEYNRILKEKVASLGNVLCKKIWTQGTIIVDNTRDSALCLIILHATYTD